MTCISTDEAYRICSDCLPSPFVILRLEDLSAVALDNLRHAAEHIRAGQIEGHGVSLKVLQAYHASVKIGY